MPESNTEPKFPPPLPAFTSKHKFQNAPASTRYLLHYDARAYSRQRRGAAASHIYYRSIRRHAPALLQCRRSTHARHALGQRLSTSAFALRSSIDALFRRDWRTTGEWYHAFDDFATRTTFRFRHMSVLTVKSPIAYKTPEHHYLNTQARACRLLTRFRRVRA